MNNEDTAVLDYFKDKKNGFYVDVGCHHPTHINNTYLLYKQNWGGINIDTSQFSIDLFNYMRPQDLNYNCAISNRNGVVKLFFQKEFSQLSTIEGTQAKNVFQGRIKEKDIQAFTLDEILNRDKYKNTKIDFLNIDVEGADLKVLEGLSFDKFKPELVCIEIHAKEIKQSDI
jgi:FkbM family methyltransferase